MLETQFDPSYTTSPPSRYLVITYTLRDETEHQVGSGSRLSIIVFLMITWTFRINLLVLSRVVYHSII